jgi:hypothetical protein
MDPAGKPYVAHLRRRDSDGLPSDLDAVRQLVASRGWQLVMELIDTAHGDAVSRLLFSHTGAEGRVLEQAEYARLTGFLAGLDQARVAAEAVITYAERVQTRED